MKPFTFHLDDELKAALQRIRERDGISEAEQIRRGVQLWLNSKGVKQAAVRRAQMRRKA